MGLFGEADLGALYCFDGSSAKKNVAPTTISNGLCWSADATQFYYIDTPTRTVDVFVSLAITGSPHSFAVCLVLARPLCTTMK